MSNVLRNRSVSVLEITTPLSAVTVTVCSVSEGCSASSDGRSADSSPAEIRIENNIIKRLTEACPRAPQFDLPWQVFGLVPTSCAFSQPFPVAMAYRKVLQDIPLRAQLRPLTGFPFQDICLTMIFCKVMNFS